MLIKEIAKKVGNGNGSTSCNLKKLFAQGSVNRNRVKNIIGLPYVYRIKENK